MRIEQLEYAAAVARLGSFRRAAEELHLSQPALSATVRNLERELGIELFERGRGGARVSDTGGELLPHLVAVLDAADTLRKAASDQHQALRMVRLGTVNAATVPLLTSTIAAVRSVHPTTQIEVVSAQEIEIDRGLSRRQLRPRPDHLSGRGRPPAGVRDRRVVPRTASGLPASGLPAGRP